MAVGFTFSSNSAVDLFKTSEFTPDCMSVLQGWVTWAMSYATYTMIVLGILFIISGISCFFYIKNSDKDDEASL